MIRVKALCWFASCVFVHSVSPPGASSSRSACLVLGRGSRPLPANVVRVLRTRGYCSFLRVASTICGTRSRARLSSSRPTGAIVVHVVSGSMFSTGYCHSPAYFVRASSALPSTVAVSFSPPLSACCQSFVRLCRCSTRCPWATISALSVRSIEACRASHLSTGCSSRSAVLHLRSGLLEPLLGVVGFVCCASHHVVPVLDGARRQRRAAVVRVNSPSLFERGAVDVPCASPAAFGRCPVGYDDVECVAGGPALPVLASVRLGRGLRPGDDQQVQVAVLAHLVACG